METDLVYITVDERLADVIFKMSRAGTDIAIVKSKNDIVGLITTSDIYSALVKEVFEENTKVTETPRVIEDMKVIDIQKAHDLYVYLFSKVRNSNNKFVLQSQFYKFVIICCKLQKYIYSNFRERDNCHVTIDSNKKKNEELFVHCNPEGNNKY